MIVFFIQTAAFFLSMEKTLHRPEIMNTHILLIFSKAVVVDSDIIRDKDALMMVTSIPQAVISGSRVDVQNFLREKELR